MKITDIEVDDNQTGSYWIQIFASNQKQAISLKQQILKDQAIRDRLEKRIEASQKIISKSSSKWEMALQNFLIEQLLIILEGEERNQV